MERPNLAWKIWRSGDFPYVCWIHQADSPIRRLQPLLVHRAQDFAAPFVLLPLGVAVSFHDAGGAAPRAAPGTDLSWLDSYSVRPGTSPPSVTSTAAVLRSIGVLEWTEEKYGGQESGAQCSHEQVLNVTRPLLTKLEHTRCFNTILSGRSDTRLRIHSLSCFEVILIKTFALRYNSHESSSVKFIQGY